MDGLTKGDFTEAASRGRSSAPGWPRPSGRSRTTRPPWRSRPSTPTGCRTCAWCFSRAPTSAASSSTPTPNRRRAASSPPNPQAALVFHWKSLRRQMRARGAVTEVSEAEADAYFASRPRDSRIGAWASQQSRPLESRFALEKAVAFYAAKHAIGEVPRPPLLARLSHRAGLDGVLGGPPLSPARPGEVRQARRGLGEDAALSVTRPRRSFRRERALAAGLSIPDRLCGRPGWLTMFRMMDLPVRSQ